MMSAQNAFIVKIHDQIQAETPKKKQTNNLTIHFNTNRHTLEILHYIHYNITDNKWPGMKRKDDIT